MSSLPTKNDENKNENKNKLIIEKDENSCSTITRTTTTPTEDDSKANRSFCDYSYVVLLSAFTAYMLSSLLGSCFGVIYDSIENELHISRSKVAFIGALLSSLDNLLGPISSAFINRYGCRKSTIVGGLLIAVGIIGSGFVNDFWILCLLMGGVSGLGSSLVSVSTIVVATYYFEDKPSFASGFVMSGGSLGPTIFPLIIIKLIEIYERAGCFLILGGLMLNIIVCGALFRPLYWEADDYVADSIECDEEEESEVINIEEDDENVDFDACKNSKVDVFKNAECIECAKFIELTSTQDSKLESNKKEASFINRLKNYFFNKNKSKTNENEKTSPVPLLSIESHQCRRHLNHHHYHHHHRYNHHNLPEFINHFPLNLRNYYYKSLINLNTRLMLDNNVSPTVLSSNNSTLELATVNNDENFDAKLSLSCPNLSPQVSKQTASVDDLNYRFKKYQDFIQKKNHHEKANDNKLPLESSQEEATISKQQEDIRLQIDDDELAKELNLHKIFKKFKKILENLFNSILETLKLFRIVEFSIFAVCNLILNLFYEAPFYFINSYMTGNNYTQNEAGFVSVCIGVAGIIASIAYGYIGDLKRIDWIIWIYAISLYLNALCHFLVPIIINSYALITIFMILISMFISVTDVLVPIICVHIVGNDDFVSAYGLMFFCQGVSCLLGPPILGMIADYTGSYAHSYRIGGIGMCLSASTILLILVRNKCKKIKKSSNSKETTD